jgi:SEC-C motif-containing protein
MRSRYSAFVRGDRDHLLASWHPSTRPASLDLEMGVRWLGLQVIDHRETGPDCAEVEFVARSRPPGGGEAQRLHERSRFVREDGRWYYLDGVMS